MSPKTSPNILVFDLSRHSHLPSYIQFLLEYWCAKNLDGQLTIMVWHTFLRSHPDVVDLAKNAPRGNVRFMTLKREEWRKKAALEKDLINMTIPFSKLLKKGDSADFAILYDWELFCHYVEQLEVDHCFIIHLDHFLPLLASGLSAPSLLSGIFFNPSFHYPASGANELLQASHLAGKFMLARAIRQRSLHTLFLLDPIVFKKMDKFPEASKVVYLPDPVKISPPFPEQVSDLRAALGIEEQRRIFMLFGHQTRRKGLEQILMALPLLSVEIRQKICLLVIGKAHPNFKARIAAQIDELGTDQAVQIITRYNFVLESELPAYFQLADVILCPYLDHVGMSGVMLRAAAANKPVLSSDYGLMGEMVSRYRLGLAVDANEPQEIADALQIFVEEDPHTIGDSNQMALLAEQHQAHNFAAIAFENLGVTKIT